MAVAQDKRASELTAPVSIAGTDFMAGVRPGTGGEPNLDIKMTIAQVRDQVPAIGVMTTAGRSLENKLAEGSVSVMDPPFGAVGNGTTDDSAACQAAADYAAANNKNLLFPSGFSFKISAVRLTNRTTPWHVFMQGSKLINPATSTSDIPCLYASALDAPAGSTRTYDYTIPVVLHGPSFIGTGYGVGYKHCIAGNLTVHAPFSSGMGTGIKCIGVAGARIYNPRMTASANYHIHFAPVAGDTYSVNYTSEGTGWNDGILIQGGSLGSCKKAVYHEGSTSEGVLTIDTVILAAATEAFVELKAPMQTFKMTGCWTEYMDTAGADFIRLLKSASSFEGSGRAIIENNHFYGNGTFRYILFNEWRNYKFEDNVVQIGPSATYTGGIWSQSGATRRWGSVLTVTPHSTTNFNSQGKITILERDIAAFGVATAGNITRNIYYMTDGTAKYLLKYSSRLDTGGGVYGTIFTIHAYQDVYTRQFPTFNDNWLSTTEVSLRVAPIGVSVDFANPTLGATFVGPTVTIDAGQNGSITSNGLGEMYSNTISGITPDKWYSQREFGRVRQDNNSYFTGT